MQGNSRASIYSREHPRFLPPPTDLNCDVLRVEREWNHKNFLRVTKEPNTATKALRFHSQFTIINDFITNFINLISTDPCLHKSEDLWVMKTNQFSNSVQKLLTSRTTYIPHHDVESVYVWNDVWITKVLIIHINTSWKDRT